MNLKQALAIRYALIKEVLFLRIIAGLAKALVLKSPKGLATRPTADRVKEALFSVLMPYLENAVVLDVFGGSGALGLEAVSRGAVRAVFIEANAATASLLKANVTAAGFTKQAKVITGDALKIIPVLKGQKFNLVFLDPPYNKGLLNKTIQSLANAGILEDEAVLTVETSSKNKEYLPTDGFRVFKESKYGDTTIIYLIWEGVS